MAMRRSFGQFLCAMLLFAVVGAAQSAVIRGDFSGVVQAGGPPFAGPPGSSYSAHYTYDSAAPPVPLPGVFADLGSGYRGNSFVIDGTALQSVVIAIANDLNGADLLWVLSGLDGVPAMQLGGPTGLWTSETLGVLDLIVFGDFTGTDQNRVFADVSGLVFGSITSWSQALAPTEVTEPATVAILGLGMVGIALSRRRRATRVEFR